MSSRGAPANKILDDPFYYGWREVPKRLPDGATDYEYQPLGPDDFLDPQPGDVMIQGTLHWDCAKDLHNRFEVHLLDDPGSAAFADLKMCWGIAGLKEPAPDLAIVRGVRDKHASRSSFDVPADGTRPCLIVEVMSPRYQGDATEKVQIYERAGIDEYLIVKPYGPQLERRFSLTGYRLAGGLYRPWLPDAQGYFRSATVGVGLRARPDGSDIEVVATATGEPLRGMAATELERRREAARAEAMAERAQTEAARAEAAEARAAAEADQLRQAAAQLARARAKLRELGIDPDEIQ